MQDGDKCRIAAQLNGDIQVGGTWRLAPERTTIGARGEKNEKRRLSAGGKYGTLGVIARVRKEQEQLS